MDGDAAMAAAEPGPAGAAAHADPELAALGDDFEPVERGGTAFGADRQGAAVTMTSGDPAWGDRSKAATWKFATGGTAVGYGGFGMTVGVAGAKN